MEKDLRDMVKDGMLISYRHGGVSDVNTIYLYGLYDSELKYEMFGKNFDIMEVFEETETGYESIWKRGGEKFYWCIEILKDKKEYLNYHTEQSSYTLLSKDEGAFYKTKFTQSEYDELVSNGIIKDVFTKEEIK